MSDTQTRPLGAQISHMLKSRGVEVIFGIPGFTTKRCTGASKKPV